MKYIQNVKKTEKVLAQYPSDGGNKIILKTDKRIYECEVAWPNSCAEALLKIIADGGWEWKQVAFGVTDLQVFTYPSLDVLYTLKMSHRYRKDSPHFLKTLRDIQLMRKLGAKIPSQYLEWFKWREAETYVNTLPKLNQSKKDFFDNSNDIYVVDHDSIHEAVKHLSRPAYEYFKSTMAEVMTSKGMFSDCSREVQLYAALEEVMVLSIERAILPFKLVGEARRAAFDKAHMKLATSISSGWFREFVWENYDEVQAMYSEEYVEKFYKALAEGKIKKFNSDEIYVMESLNESP